MILNKVSWTAVLLLTAGLALMWGCQSENPGVPVAIRSESSANEQPVRNQFDEAILEVNFKLDADDNGPKGQNGIPDSFEMALLDRILADPDFNLSAANGVVAGEVIAAFEQCRKSASLDIASHLKQWPRLATLVAGYAMVGTPESFEAINRLSTSFGTPLNSDYSLASQMGKWLGPIGDADGDGATNLEEYHAFGKQGREQFVAAALDPKLKPTTEQLKDLALPKATRFTVGIILYDGFEVLDVYGPAEIWGNVPEFELATIAEKSGPVKSAQGLETIASFSFETAPKVDIMLVPGGLGTIAQLKNEKLLDYLVKADADSMLTTSVCTGSALLAKARILDGHGATSNKAFFELARRQSDRVDWKTNARWVEDGKFFTSSGVSAGTDMSLAVVGKLFGEQRSKALADQLEYIWHDKPNDDPFAGNLNNR